MALQPISAKSPLSFDALDAQTTSPLGGEVATLSYISITGTDRAAEDVDDGYTGVSDTRIAATTTLASGNRPLFLVDEGTSGYGTLFGEVVGGTVGKQVTGGTVLGPHSANGSGKWTLWYEPGLYTVTLDAVDETHNSGLVPENNSLAGGDPLYATSAGLLTPNAAAAFEAVVVARFLEFAPNGSLVTTPLGQIQAANSPSGSSAPGAQFDVALILWNPELS